MLSERSEAVVISLHDVLRDRRARGAQPRPTTVLIAGGRSLVRAGVRVWLERDARIEVVGEAACADRALEMAGDVHPDVVLADAADVLPATAPLAATGAAVLLLAEPGDEPELYGALRAGARGIVPCDAGPDELARAVRTVARGDAVLSAAAVNRLLLLVEPQPA